MSLGGFQLAKADISYLGTGLSRPESVLVEADGTLWVSDKSCGVTRIDPDGSQSRIGTMGGNPNGLALEPDGCLLVANVIDGALYRLRRDGRAETVIDSFEGRPLGAVNFVYRDGVFGRIWLSVSAWSKPVDGAVRPTTGRLYPAHRGRNGAHGGDGLPAYQRATHRSRRPLSLCRRDAPRPGGTAAARR